MTPFPEAHAQQGDKSRGYESQPEEAEHVVTEGDVCATDRPRREKVPEETSEKQYHSEPDKQRVALALHVIPGWRYEQYAAVFARFHSRYGRIVIRPAMLTL